MLRKINRQNIDIRKAAWLSIILNLLQIAAVVVLVVMVFFSQKRDISPEVEQWVVLAGALLVIFGALTDIGSARMNLRFSLQQEALEETYYQLEDLNRTMRAQRHDFMNHLQVVYSRVEMQEPQEATAYIDRVYGDMQRVSRVMRTDSPAINALLQAKVADCEKRGIALTLDITSRYTELKMPAWEMCRILGNLIDNAMDAVADAQEKRITVALFDDLKNYGFKVMNTGAEIPLSQRATIFLPGFTTKSTGQGMGLFIVSSLMHEYGGDIRVQCENGMTVFHGWLPKATPTEMESTKIKNL